MAGTIARGAAVSPRGRGRDRRTGTRVPLRGTGAVDVVQQNWKALGKYGTVGLDLGLSIVVGLLGGQWLDGRFGTAPWLMIAGFLLGATAGFRMLWRTLEKANRELEREEERDREARRKYLGRK